MICEENLRSIVTAGKAASGTGIAEDVSDELAAWVWDHLDESMPAKHTRPPAPNAPCCLSWPAVHVCHVAADANDLVCSRVRVSRTRTIVEAAAADASDRLDWGTAEVRPHLARRMDNIARSIGQLWMSRAAVL